MRLRDALMMSDAQWVGLRYANYREVNGPIGNSGMDEPVGMGPSVIKQQNFGLDWITSINCSNLM